MIICAFCQGNLFEAGTTRKVTTCGHIFHEHCLQSATKKTDRCPYRCKERLMVRHSGPLILATQFSCSQTMANMATDAAARSDGSRDTEIQVQTIQANNLSSSSSSSNCIANRSQTMANMATDAAARSDGSRDTANEIAVQMQVMQRNNCSLRVPLSMPRRATSCATRSKSTEDSRPSPGLISTRRATIHSTVRRRARYDRNVRIGFDEGMDEDNTQHLNHGQNPRRSVRNSVRIDRYNIGEISCYVCRKKFRLLSPHLYAGAIACSFACFKKY